MGWGCAQSGRPVVGLAPADARWALHVSGGLVSLAAGWNDPQEAQLEEVTRYFLPWVGKGPLSPHCGCLGRAAGIGEQPSPGGEAGEWWAPAQGCCVGAGRCGCGVPAPGILIKRAPARAQGEWVPAWQCLGLRVCLLPWAVEDNRLHSQDQGHLDPG